MSKQIIVFEPEVPETFQELIFPEQAILELVTQQFPDMLHNHLRIFPYVTSAAHMHRQTGFAYTLGEPDNPLSSVDDFVEIIADSAHGIDAHFSGDQFTGKATIVDPSKGNYMAALELGLLSGTSLGLGKHREMRKFFLNLDPQKFQRVIEPGLSQRGYEIDVKKVAPTDYKILAVHNDPLQGKHLCRVISKTGCEVDYCKSKTEALELIKSGQYSIVFMNWQPYSKDEPNGVEATQEIRKINPLLPVYIASAERISSEEQKQAGITGCINAKTFLDDIATAIGRHTTFNRIPTEQSYQIVGDWRPITEGDGIKLSKDNKYQEGFIIKLQDGPTLAYIRCKEHEGKTDVSYYCKIRAREPIVSAQMVMGRVAECLDGEAQTAFLFSGKDVPSYLAAVNECLDGLLPFFARVPTKWGFHANEIATLARIHGSKDKFEKGGFGNIDQELLWGYNCDWHPMI